MSTLNLPPNAKQDPNTGLYIITDNAGNTFRVGAETQSQLDSYVNSVNTGKSVSVPSTNPMTGDTRNVTFDPVAITAQTNSIAQERALLTQTKRSTGILGNSDGTYTNVRTGEKLTQEQAANAIQKAGLPPQALSAITPKNSPAYSAATVSVDSTTNTPSNLPESPEPNSTQPNPAISADNTSISPTPEQSLAETARLTEINELIENEGPTTIDQRSAETARLVAINELVENEGPATIDQRAAETARLIEINEIPESTDPGSTGSAKGLPGLVQRTRTVKTAQDQSNFNSTRDWRVRLSLAPNANYLYNLSNPGILAPLKETDGVIFPYTPTISVTYVANYDNYDLTHSNYKIFQYKNSAIESIGITAEFTAQDTNEANYLLAVIHFLRSVTKMFYGKDENPKAGTPPPLCFLSGMGDYQFNEHPLVINNFVYTLPNNVDYIRSNTISNRTPATTSRSSFLDPMQSRLIGVGPGGEPPPTVWTSNDKTNPPTYVPTKIQLQINAYPIVSRNAISNKFSLADYGTGELLLGNKNASGGFFGGIW